jgi:DNA-binding NarL/FixJ family response regulator
VLNILLIEDHALVREGMAQLVRQLDDEVNVFEAADGEAGVAVLEREPDLDLVLLDLSLPGMDGLSWMKLQRRRFPAIPIVVVSAHDDGDTIGKVMRAGAAGFVPKASPTDRLLDALRRVLDGEIVEPSKLPSYPMGVDHPGSSPVRPASGKNRARDLGLTPRQNDVLQLLGKGKSNAEIAHLLGLTEGTVKIHVTAVLKALGVKNRTQAMVAANRLHIKG